MAGKSLSSTERRVMMSLPAHFRILAKLVEAEGDACNVAIGGKMGKDERIGSQHGEIKGRV
jgi:hypothetical protein